MPVADAEIIFGPYTEYTGIRFAVFLLAEYAGIVVLAALTTVLFLGGWQGPWSDTLGWLWTLLKVGAVAFLVIWARVAYPRLREDQLQKLAWTVTGSARPAAARDHHGRRVRRLDVSVFGKGLLTGLKVTLHNLTRGR